MTIILRCLKSLYYYNITWYCHSTPGQHASGGSVRSVTTSTAIGADVTVKKDLDAGQWSEASTFRNFYYKLVPMNHFKKMMSSL